MTSKWPSDEYLPILAESLEIGDEILSYLGQLNRTILGEEHDEDNDDSLDLYTAAAAAEQQKIAGIRKRLIKVRPHQNWYKCTLKDILN